MKPILKWPGGKQWLAAAAPLLVPPTWTGQYIEPFFGGGALFFALEPSRAILSDRNSDLITTYRGIRDDAKGVIRRLRKYPYDKAFFYALRSKVPTGASERAARILYLTRTCWNGLYRVNREGKFNTPFGDYKNPTICDSLRIKKAASLLRRASLRVGDFSRSTAVAVQGDFVYLDPPYITGHQNNGFLKYNARLYSWSDQERLAQEARRLSKSGVSVLVSNADQPSVVDLYGGFYYYRIIRRSLIAGNADSRGTTTEALFSNYPVLGFESEIL